MALTLTPSQQAAADRFADFILDKTASELVLTGGAGYGKSTLTRHILKILQPLRKMVNLLLDGDSHEDIPVHVTATTNQAAKVIGDMVGEAPQTIYSLLGLVVYNDRQTGKTYLKEGRNYRVLEKAIIFIDEASYLNDDALKKIRAATYKCKLILIGDKDQLVSPKEKHCPVFTNPLNVTQLMEPVRNSGPIWELAEQYRQAVVTGLFPMIEPAGNEILVVDGPTFQAMVDEDFKDPERDEFSSKILCWRNSTVNGYNDYIRRELHGRGEALEVGERVMTNKPIVGKLPTDARSIVTYVGEPSEEHGIPGRPIKLQGAGELFVPDDQSQVNAYLNHLKKHKAWSTFFEIKENWGDLRPLHACTVHKSQGSTYRRTYLNLGDIGGCNIASDFARLMYVGTSRAAKQLVLYGDLPFKYSGIPLEKVDAWA